ncbi:hypothetical protein GOQ27_05715 [Clostridium sp. D2Q-11]|uniref:Uncharacterized protein n=1 Tax=Anaeromonas frigoriresistens TaxID=2683708 RepID=A0A942URP1_9FIRM|nr:hypothetical protein [Anaeromonas frigoriresistens]MBS4537948.1 hypothetical protein [Anaeromonas frigoriresistens]
MNNLNGNRVIDERQERKIGKAAIISSLVTYFYLLVEITYKYIKTKDISSLDWEIILLILNSVIFYLVTRDQKEMNLPKSILGKKLPTSQSKEARKKRFISYIYQSILFSVSIGVITFIFSVMKVDSISYFNILLEILGLFLISLIIEYIIGERRCKKYVKWEKSLDEDK